MYCSVTAAAADTASLSLSLSSLGLSEKVGAQFIDTDARTAAPLSAEMQALVDSEVEYIVLKI